jgi:hypothetical protein
VGLIFNGLRIGWICRLNLQLGGSPEFIRGGRRGGEKQVGEGALLIKFYVAKPEGDYLVKSWDRMKYPNGGTG